MGKRQKRIFLSVVSLFVFGLIGFAQAEEGAETKATIKDIQGQEGKKDVDDLITNRKLRAETGSKSKISVRSAFNYNGGTVTNAGGRVRPNIRAATNEPAFSALSGSLAGKYNIDTKNSISAGVSLRMLQPFNRSINDTTVTRYSTRTEELKDSQGNTVKDQNGNAVTVEVQSENQVARNDVNNPYLSWAYLSKIGSLQSAFNMDLAFTTANNFRAVGSVANLAVGETLIKDIGTSGLSVGASMSASAYVFDKFGEEEKANSADYDFGIYPFIEYVINDTFNLRTVAGVWVYEHVRSTRDSFTFAKNTIYQSIGLGISVTRDIYLYPNVQFLPENIRQDLTNIGLAANINVF